jgi:16S rRNA G966 N2-methylase RsmD
MTYQKRIDLQDGSGVQVFEAESPEQLVDILVESQRHATKKIREQSRRIKALEREAGKLRLLLRVNWDGGGTGIT